MGWQRPRWLVGVLVIVMVLAGCGDPDQKMRSAAAQAARATASEVNTARLAVEQLQAGRLWQQPAEQLVKDAEKAVGKAATTFSSQQPTTDASRRTYEQVTDVLDDAETAVTAIRIALGNDDLAAAVQQAGQLQKTSDELDRIGELTK
jgi:hypothetical protein